MSSVLAFCNFNCEVMKYDRDPAPGPTMPAENPSSEPTGATIKVNSPAANDVTTVARISTTVTTITPGQRWTHFVHTMFKHVIKNQSISDKIAENIEVAPSPSPSPCPCPCPSPSPSHLSHNGYVYRISIRSSTPRFVAIRQRTNAGLKLSSHSKLSRTQRRSYPARSWICIRIQQYQV